MLWLVLQHVLPKGFRRVRNYGFLHPNRRPPKPATAGRLAHASERLERSRNQTTLANDPVRREARHETVRRKKMR
ncbi:transposase [Pseudomonas stutzeri]|nr:transposase [Stutzerimonas stutzeri]MCQ4323196.1 transposase [Stutzerimonas stutzeri]